MPNHDHEISYDIIASAFTSVALRYNITAFRTRNVFISNAISDRLFADFFLKYDVSSNIEPNDFDIVYAFPIHKDFDITWNLAAPLEANIEISYSMPDEAKVDIDIENAILNHNPIKKDVVFYYNLQDLNIEGIRFEYLRD